MADLDLAQRPRLGQAPVRDGGIAYEALDNGFRSCEDPRALQRICDRLGSGAVKGFLWRWQHRLPSPFTRNDLRAGYTYELAFRQFEVSDTRVFDRPQAGRSFFEGVIRDHLDIGRPSQVALIFDRRINSRTPGKFRTRVLTKGVDPQLSCTYKSSRIKLYFKEHRALRTEVVVCDTRDSGIGRRVNFGGLLIGLAARLRVAREIDTPGHPESSPTDGERTTGHKPTARNWRPRRLVSEVSLSDWFGASWTMVRVCRRKHGLSAAI